MYCLHDKWLKATHSLAKCFRNLDGVKKETAEYHALWERQWGKPLPMSEGESYQHALLDDPILPGLSRMLVREDYKEALATIFSRIQHGGTGGTIISGNCGTGEGLFRDRSSESLQLFGRQVAFPLLCSACPAIKQGDGGLPNRWYPLFIITARVFGIFPTTPTGWIPSGVIYLHRR